jgi:hypothetical protein
MFSAVAEGAGYRVAVVGKREALRRQPSTVGGIAIWAISDSKVMASPLQSRRLWQVVSHLEQRAFLGISGATLSTHAQRFLRIARRTVHSRARALVHRLPGTLLARPGSPELGRTPAGAPAEPALSRKLDDLTPDLILALDPVALQVAQAASVRGRGRGASIAVGYDRARFPVADSGWDRREAALLGNVDLGTAASSALASDQRWPQSLTSEVSVVYSTPLGLAADTAGAKPLADELGQASRSRVVGLFLPRALTEGELSRVVQAVTPIASDHVVVFGSSFQLASCLRRLDDGATSLQPLPDEDDVLSILPYLDVIVCPSTWAPGLPPSVMAIASAIRGQPLVASSSVCEELEFGAAVAGPRPEATAAAIGRALDGMTTGRDRATHPAAAPASLSYSEQARHVRATLNATDRYKVGIGPRNGNGQAWAWTQALRRKRPTLPVEAFAVDHSGGRLAMVHKCDVFISKADWRRREWQKWWAHRLQAQFSHLLIEQGLTACGSLHGKRYFDDLPYLLESGIKVGLVFRGSEIRDPAAHAARERWSPFADPDDPLTAELQAVVAEPRRRLRDFDVPLFVTTLDLLDDVPQATWLPQVLDLEDWSPGSTSALGRDRPVVLHAPPRAEQMKGSHWVDDVCEPLSHAGAIDYRRLHGVPFAEMPSRIRDADIVIDSLASGSYGVLTLQAMACERLVIGHVSEQVRHRLDGTLPVLQAEPPDLERVITDALADRAGSQALARSGRDYVRRYHSGEESADRLLRHLVDE